MSTPITSDAAPWTATAIICATVCANSANAAGRTFAWAWILFAAAFWLARGDRRKEEGAQG